jgi:PAS domain S-box-containing protein
VQIKNETRDPLNNLVYLPAFAQYLLEHRLDQMVQLQIQISKEVNVPVLKLFKDFSDERIIKITKRRLVELLTCLAQNKAQQQIEASVQQWKKNRLPFVQKDDIVAEDITLVTYLRKKLFLYFLPDYCSQTDQMIELIKEIDLFLTEGETTAANLYIQLLKERIDDHSHFIEKITNTSPGIIYVYDVINNKEIYTNKTITEFLGFDPEDITSMGDKFVETLIYPGDLATLRQYEEEFKTTKDGEVRSFRYRIKNNKGEYRWLRTYETVFKRNADGEISEKIGIAIDVHKQKTTADQLHKREAELLEAQEIAQLGSFTWSFGAEPSQGSSQAKKILEIAFDKIEEFINRVHPDDRKKLEAAIEESFKTGKFESEYRYLGDKAEKTIWGRGLINYENGQPKSMYGTVMDITEKQKLIQQLKENESLYQQAQALTHIGNYSWDVATNNIKWSDELYRIYGLEPQSVSTPFDFIEKFNRPEDTALVRKFITTAINTKQPFDFYYRIVAKNGKEKTLHARGNLKFDDDGNVKTVIGTAQDVTEQQQVQHELKENQTFIRKITDATPSIIASYNVNTGKYVFISEGLEKLLGYDTKDVMEQGVQFFANIVHSDDVEQMMEKNAGALQEANAHPEKNDMVIEFIYRMRHKNGSYRWFHTYGTIFDRNGEGKVEHVLNISLDVTEQKEATQKIAEQEHFIQQIADASPTILYLYDVDEQSIVYINREIFFVLGHLPDEIMDAGNAITEWLYHPEDFHLLPGRKQSNKNFQQVDSMMQYECRMKKKDGEWCWFLVREIVFKTDEAGNTKQILGAALDISHRKEMEKTILQNAMLLEQSNASLEEFAYVASHDLKEPLRKISTFGDRLTATQAGSLSPEGKIYLKKIVDASQRMQTMISDLLSISMISGNHSFENYSLQKILDETVQTLEFKIEQQNAVIQSDPLPEARIIPSQIRQLFQNLLSNSLKFTKEGVQPIITIKYSIATEKELMRYQLTQAERYHQIEISDNGIGFENEFAGKIFAIFQRLHGRSEYEGSGIGLAICKKIVEHHGGTIYASGALDVGATFTIILPA